MNEYITDNCIKVQCFSPFHYRFIFVDTCDHVSKRLFKASRIRVFHARELAKRGSPFRLIVCYIRKKDLEKFKRLLEILKSNILILGYKDYEMECQRLRAAGDALSGVKSKGEVIRMTLSMIKDDKAKVFTQKLSEMIESSEIQQLSGEDRDEYEEAVSDMKKKAASYARFRTEWEFMSKDEKIEKDSLRTSHHNEFMTAAKLLIRLSNMHTDNKWAKLQEEAESMQRKDFGDIACYITYLIAVSNR